MSLLIVFAGPNGSGKTSLIHQTRQTPFFPDIYISPDILFNQKDLLGETDIRARYITAMRRAEELRHYCLRTQTPFAFETVLSQQDKLDFMLLAKERGFLIEFVYVTTSDPSINLTRIRQRVATGGHDVPEEKVIARYHRSMALLPTALQIADTAKVYDNSIPDSHPTLVYYKRSLHPPLLTNREIRPPWVNEVIVAPLQASGAIATSPIDLSVEETRELVQYQHMDRIKYMSRRIHRHRRF